MSPEVPPIPDNQSFFTFKKYFSKKNMQILGMKIVSK